MREVAKIMIGEARSKAQEVLFYQRGATVTRRVYAPSQGQRRWQVSGLCGATDPRTLRVTGRGPSGAARLIEVALSTEGTLDGEDERSLPLRSDSARAQHEQDALLSSLKDRFARLLKIQPRRLNREGAVSQSLAAGRFIESALSALEQRILLLETGVQHVAEAPQAERPVEQLQTLTLSFDAAGELPDFIDVSYFVPTARWWPCYTLSFEEGGRRAQLLLEAQLWQESGEHWEEVTLQVSNAPAPQAGELRGAARRRQVRLQAPSPALREHLRAPEADLLSSYREAEQLQLLETPSALGCAAPQQPALERDAPLEEFSLSPLTQGLSFEHHAPLCAAPDETRAPPPLPTALEPPELVTGAAFSYRASSPLTVKSAEALQRLPLERSEGESTLRLSLCPRQGPSAFRSATLRNPASTPLLPGPVDLFFEGLLLRRAVLPLTPEGGSLSFELGVEQRLQATRKLEEQRIRRGLLKEQDQIERSVELIVRSGMNVEVQCGLFEPLPHCEEAGLQQSLTHADPLPEEQEDRISWSLTLAPGSSKSVSCRYLLRYPSRYQLHWEER